MLPNKNTKYGFTLSEVLVTLAMMGILGSILIPTIIAKRPNETKIMLKKEYMVLERAVAKMINDETVYPSSQTFVGADTKTYQQGFSYTTDPTTQAGTIHKFCYYLVDNLNIIGAPSCPQNTVATDNRATLFATTSDGADWYISRATPLADEFKRSSYPTNYYYSPRIVIDVNGANPPNCLADTNCATFGPAAASLTPHTCACTNPDTFIIGVAFNGKLKPASSNFLSTNMGITDTYAESYLISPLDNK